ncbi:heme peroxidase family protein [Kineococcus gypseus]|uniref:peroxidase family protein n=1 Tax=Kineococcus gypseus TaxID=1637102 RepID=UPI003D7EAA64
MSVQDRTSTDGATPPPTPPTPPSTTPTSLHRHARTHRGLATTPSSSTRSGRFGRMFRHLPVFTPEPAHLKQLAERMVVSPGGPREGVIPAGYTYLGQFVDHDITFDPVSSLQRQNDPDGLRNFRTPRFDLDCLYGRGPADQPYLYEQTDGVTTFLLGDAVGTGPGGDLALGRDLPRNGPRERGGSPNFFSRALIGDPRNDENLLVSQFHLTMLQFHNRVITDLAATSGLTGDDLFKEAQRQVRWHYQWAVVHDFLPRIVGQDVVDDVLRTEGFVAGGQTFALTRPHLLFYRPGHDAYVPVEFAVAAYRFGHSMVRGRYHINDFVKQAREGAGQGPIPTFGPEPTSEQDELNTLNGFRRLPPFWGVEWHHLFDGLPGSAEQRQLSLAVDTNLAPLLGQLPSRVTDGEPRSLAERNLLRGASMALPDGATVAEAMGIPALSPSDLGIDDLPADVRAHPPLWFYVLKEAELGGGERLGPVGGRIVAEVLLGLLVADPTSYLDVAPTWQPTLPRLATSTTFDVPSVLAHAKGLSDGG